MNRAFGLLKFSQNTAKFKQKYQTVMRILIQDKNIAWIRFELFLLLSNINFSR